MTSADDDTVIAGAMFALPRQADIVSTAGHVRKVPGADIFCARDRR
jgi:hypothetical protein